MPKWLNTQTEYIIRIVYQEITFMPKWLYAKYAMILIIIIIIIIIIDLKQNTTIGAAGCKLLLSIIISFVSNPGA